MLSSSELITAREAARRLGITRIRVALLISSGILPARRVGRDWIIEASDLAGVIVEVKRRNHLSQEQIQEIQIRARGGESINELARVYHVSDRTIYRHLK
jgi:excisionase family DNA binding protein